MNNLRFGAVAARYVLPLPLSPYMKMASGDWVSMSTICRLILPPRTFVLLVTVCVWCTFYQLQQARRVHKCHRTGTCPNYDTHQCFVANHVLWWDHEMICRMPRERTLGSCLRSVV